MQHQGEKSERGGNLEREDGYVAAFGVQRNENRQARHELLITEGEKEAFKDVYMGSVAPRNGLSFGSEQAPAALDEFPVSRAISLLAKEALKIAHDDGDQRNHRGE